ncbi:MAG: glutamate--tRNA ligase [Ruminococcaceae bacterium]|nr:glutamate--tRNA ligase [Oscillospiraceae bacterium]
MTQQERNELAELLYPKATLTTDEVERMFPKRQLPEGARVTRMAPSPTGFVHFGNLFPALTSERLAHQSGGVMILRIEDTDAKRAVEGAVEIIINSLKHYNIIFDEGATMTEDIGIYGPYYQSRRAEIYQAFAKKLIREGKAYPCFCTEEELEQLRAQQEASKENFGYYGKFAKHRDMSLEEIKAELAQGKPFALRFRSEGSLSNKIPFDDIIKGHIEVTENDIDHVLLKSDGIPTYHFAHAIDDHFMGTTHVIRGDEWLSTLPLHLQLFDALGFEKLKYMHISPLMKMDGDSKRKLSKRKDPEAALTFYQAQGYPVLAVLDYVMMLLNSNYEEWRIQNPAAPYTDFEFKAENMSVSGSLFDIVKLNDVSKNIISTMTSQQVYDYVADWADEYDKDFAALIKSDKDYAVRIFSIGRGGEKPRKDLAMWSEAKAYMGFFYDELYEITCDFPENISKEDTRNILESYKNIYVQGETQEEWFGRITALATENGFAAKPKEYKKNPDAYKGHVGDVSMILRIAVSGRQNSPDMYEIMEILGKERVIERIDNALKAL